MDAFPVIELFPPEIVALVAEKVDVHDWLSLKFSCNTFAALLPGRLQPTLDDATQDDKPTQYKAAMDLDER